MIRKAAAKHSDKNGFRMRGHEIKRIETFCDAVFAFAVTLLIVSLEVPRNFEQLINTMSGFPAFGISFLFLMLIWHEQNIFFRRYGLDDTATVVLNCILMFIILFFVYPLKFLFSLILNNGNASIKPEQFPALMTIYGAAFVAIYFLLFLMHRHALKQTESPELNATETFDTKTKMFSYIVFLLIGCISVILAWTLPLRISGLSGIFYMIIGPALSIYYSYRGKRRKKLFVAETAGDPVTS